MIVIAAMFSTNAEGLTWRSPGNKLHAYVRPPINLAHIAAEDWPLSHMLDTLISVVKHRFDGVSVPFDHEIVMEARACQTETQTPTTSKQFDATHDPNPS
jgi:hypothetical protein